MAEVACQVVRWVDDEPPPGLVEAQLTDADGAVWSFIDKSPIFSVLDLSESTLYPVRGVIRCSVIDRELLGDGGEIVEIDTERPDGVDADGRTRFWVRSSQVN